MAAKSLPWLRLYTEFASDYKVQMLPEAMQRRLIMLFCFQREGTLNSMSDNEISYRLGISKRQWKLTRERLQNGGFLNDDEKIKNGDDFLRNFALRQKASDNYAELKRNQRLRAVCLNDVLRHHQDMSQECLNLDIDKDKDKDKEEEKIKTISSERKNLHSELVAIPDDNFISLSLVDKTEFHVCESVVQEFENCYPAVRVREELKKMRAYFFSNPVKRKTRRGIMKAINSWLARTQDAGVRPLNPTFAPRPLNNVQHNQLVLEEICKEEDEKMRRGEYSNLDFIEGDFKHDTHR